MTTTETRTTVALHEVIRDMIAQRTIDAAREYEAAHNAYMTAPGESTARDVERARGAYDALHALSAAHADARLAAIRMGAVLNVVSQ